MVECNKCVHYSICSHYKDHRYECSFFMNDKNTVEVVRCKDCKNFCAYEGEEHKGDCAELVGLESCVYEDDFCSYGERKDNGC